MVVKYVYSKQITGKCNKFHVITVCRDKIMPRKKLKENTSILNHIRYIQAIGNKMNSLPTNPPAPDHIGDILKSTIRSKLYN